MDLLFSEVTPNADLNMVAAVVNMQCVLLLPQPCLINLSKSWSSDVPGGYPDAARCMTWQLSTRNSRQSHRLLMLSIPTHSSRM